MIANVAVCGSPPRGWGKRTSHDRQRRRMRFTPTRVGKTVFKRWLVLLVSVHPHAGGENYLSWLLQIFYDRFTPTRVGKTGCMMLIVGICPVHPHAGGENGCPGSAAPSRGRFTPTRVGKTHPQEIPGEGSSVHPHAGGENSPPVVSLLAYYGSPPRGWGKLPPI